jgi:hypothetical protein
MTSSFDMSVEEARDMVMEARKTGITCPCCDQFCKIYRRKINMTMAKALIQLYKAGGAYEYVHCPRLPGDTHEISQFAFWRLIIEESERVREDGGRAGFWKLTRHGVAFVLGDLKVRKYALIYDHHVLGWSGPKLSIRRCFKEPFSYEELMLGV